MKIIAFVTCFGFSNVMGMTAEANISSQQCGVGETVQLVVKVTNQKEEKNLPWPTLHGDLSAFKIDKTSGVSTSSYTSIINGKITKRNDYVTQFTYNLKAIKPGTFKIGPISYSYKRFNKQLGGTSITVIFRGFDSAVSKVPLLGSK
ncbi:MAG: BatD family protein [Fibrobacteria bacterium]|nr:BatD family protein [Fibrobacteria bacterium]